MVLCYGGIALETVIDLPYTPKTGIAHIICEEHSRLGGGSAHVAEWLGSWGVPTRLAGYVLGSDGDGDQLLRWLSEHASIDLSFVQRSSDVRTLVSRTVPFTDGHKYLLCVGYGNVTVTPPTPAMFEGVEILEIAFYHRQVIGNAAAIEMARLASERGVKIVAMDVISTDEIALPPTAVVINSADSIREVFPDADVREHSLSLRAAGHGIIIVTNGKQDVWAIDHDGTEYTLRPPTVTAVDATGAGDSFRAGVIYGLRQTWSLPEALRWATAVGALQIQRGLSQDRPPSMDQIADLATGLDVRAFRS